MQELVSGDSRQFFRRAREVTGKMLFHELKQRKLAKYWHWKRRSERLVMTATEGEIGRECLPGRRRTAWIYDVKLWTVGGLPAAQRIALERL